MCVESGPIEKDHRYKGPYTIAVDFDGVIHSYEKGWHNGSIYGTPNPECVASMRELFQTGCDLIIYSVRAVDRTQFGDTTKGQADEMAKWLDRYAIPYTSIWTGQGKPFAHLYLDDNAVRFTNWASAMLTIRGIKNDWLAEPKREY